jgi:RNA polymerase sigma-70 factor (ECF subfamily)
VTTSRSISPTVAHAIESEFVAEARRRGVVVDPAGLLAWVEQAWASGSVWGVALSPAAFGAWVATRLDWSRPFAEALAAVRTDEAYLACACTAGNDAAIAVLERSFGDHIAHAIEGIADARSGPDDVRQQVRLHLFVGTPEPPPAIAQYSGTGSLAAWLRVTCKRAALNATRRKELPRSRLEPDAVLEGISLSHEDPELRFLKDRYRQEFRGAFAEALSGLDVRQRSLIRLAAIDGVGVRDIGRMYGVHHATAARWVGAAYAALVDATKATLASKLSASPSDVDSILSLIKSRLDASLARIRTDE